MKRLLSVVGAVLLLAAGTASADIIFTLSGVTFDDGGTATGTFTTNDAITAVTDYDVTTSGANGFEYTPGNSNNTSSPPSFVGFSTADLMHILDLTFVFPPGLTATGGTIVTGMLNTSFEQIPGGTHREITAGSAGLGTTTVPEPATLALLAFGVLGLAIRARNRRA